jgi:hypothetical protein
MLVPKRALCALLRRRKQQSKQCDGSPGKETSECWTHAPELVGDLHAQNTFREAREVLHVGGGGQLRVT